MNNDEFRTLKSKVGDVLRRGLSIAIIGWMDSNHDDFTRGLPAKKVQFFENTPSELGESFGYAIFTRFVGHADFVRIKKADKDKKGKDRKRVCPVVVTTGQIKKALAAHTSILAVLAEREKELPVAEGAGVVPPAETAPPVRSTGAEDAAMEYVTRTRSNHEMTNMDRFVAAFLAAMKENKKNGLVGRRTMAGLRKEHGIKESPQQLAKAGWVTPHTAPGKTEIGWYGAGNKMIEAVNHEKFEPDDPVERARFMMAKEPELFAAKAKIEAELEEVNRKLAVLEALKGLFSQIKKKTEEA